MIALAQLTDKTCRWPLGDPLADGFGFCGATVVTAPYCPACRGLAYQSRERGGVMPLKPMRPLPRLAHAGS